MNKIKFYCVTNKIINFLNHPQYLKAWVGKEEAPKHYLRCDEKKNIFDKEKYYSELTFHYWYWKNILEYEQESDWIGFCQKRRYWIKNKNKHINKENINSYLLFETENDWENYDSIICEPITIAGAKKIKLLKKGFRNIIKNPKVLFNNNQNILLHFDMHHGYGNLKKAINLLGEEDKHDFSNYVIKNNKINPHIMFISKKKVMKKWFSSLFLWLEKCEQEFGFKKLKGYDTTRLYAYLAERYLSYWFKKYTKYKEHPWTFIDIKE